MGKSERMYDSPPKVEQAEDGKMSVKKPETKAPKEADKVQAGADGVPVVAETHNANERREVKHRHIHEHLAQHHKHEMEEANHKGGSKEEMHDRHEQELADMHKRHHSEIKVMNKKHEKEPAHGETRAEKK